MRKKDTFKTNAGCSGILASLLTQDKNWLSFVSTTKINMHRRPQQLTGHQDLEQPQLQWTKVICSLTKPKPGAQRTKGQELSGGTDLLAASDFPSPTCYPIWPSNHSTYRGAGTVTERPAGLGQMPLPIKLWGRLPKKGHIKMESVYPTFQVQRALWKAAINESSKEGTDLNKCLDLPLENHNAYSYLVAKRLFLQCHFMWCRVHTRAIFKLFHENGLYQVNTVTIQSLGLS